MVMITILISNINKRQIDLTIYTQEKLELLKARSKNRKIIRYRWVSKPLIFFPI